MLRELNAADVRYLIVGGYAVMVRTGYEGSGPLD